MEKSELSFSASLSIFVWVVLSACGPGDHSGQEPPMKEIQKAKVENDSENKSTSTTVQSPVWTWQLPAGIPEPQVPEDNPMTAAKVKLGHELFFDKRLSGDGTRSCYSCHQNELGNADGRKTALGARNIPLSRNTPTIWNVAFHKQLYWDGRAESLEKQALGAWKGDNMGVGEANLAAKAKEIGNLPEYRSQFESIFNLSKQEDVTPEHVTKAISAYERTLLCGDSLYDQGTLSKQARQGWTLFRDNGCINCHTNFNFSDGMFHNVGIGVPESREEGDIGRGKITKSPEDNYKFRTPTLRNVARTAPYFHDGSVAELKAAVRYMASGGDDKRLPGLDEKFRKVELKDAEIDAIVAFLETLNCPGELEVIGDQKVEGIPEH